MFINALHGRSSLNYFYSSRDITKKQNERISSSRHGLMKFKTNIITSERRGNSCFTDQLLTALNHSVRSSDYLCSSPKVRFRVFMGCFFFIHRSRFFYADIVEESPPLFILQSHRYTVVYLMQKRKKNYNNISYFVYKCLDFLTSDFQRQIGIVFLTG